MPDSPQDHLLRQRELKARRFGRYFFLVVLVAITAAFFYMVRSFLIPVLLAAVFTALFYPMYVRLLKISKQRAGLSAFACCVVLLLGLLVPVYVLADLLSQEAVAFYESAGQKLREIVAQGDAGLLGDIKNSVWVKRLGLDQVDWQAELQNFAKTASTMLFEFLNKTSASTFDLVANLFVTLFTMYYFFKEGEGLIARLKFLTPLDDAYEDALIQRFASVSKATLKGTLVIAIVQGVLGGLTLWLFGIGSPLLWGMVMVVLSIIPMVGAWLVLYPIALVQILIGHAWVGLAIFLIGALIIGNVDNLLRPKLVGRDAGMHDLMIFFSTLGGISVFGMMGFVLGPVLAALFLTILDIYAVEFKSHLELAQAGSTSAPAEQNPAPELPPIEQEAKP
jgi:predicted PurR-regulated permease PerM